LVARKVGCRVVFTDVRAAKNDGLIDLTRNAGFLRPSRLLLRRLVTFALVSERSALSSAMDSNV
jgi:hypothetical protein